MSKKFSRQELITILNEVRIGIRNSLKHNQVKDRIINQGYDDANFAAADANYQEAEIKFMEKDKAYAEKLNATRAFRKILKKGWKYYIKMVKLFRRAFLYDPETMEALGLYGKRVKARGAWIIQAKEFFNTAKTNEDIFNKMTRFAVTQEKLQKGLDFLTDIETSDEFKNYAKGEAERSTFFRNKVFTVVYRWLVEFKQACLNEFEDDPQILEMIGIPALTEGYKRNKKEPVPEETTEQPQENAA